MFVYLFQSGMTPAIYKINVNRKDTMLKNEKERAENTPRSMTTINVYKIASQQLYHNSIVSQQIYLNAVNSVAYGK